MSTTDRRVGKKVPLTFRREDALGVRVDSGPYIGKIKNNFDPTRTGRLQVWIPDLGAGDESDPSNWRTVSYASPFFGSTAQHENDKNNKFKSVKHTYGLWFTVPDLDNFVICTFIAGDPMRGFWFACVPNQLGQHMVPAIAGSKNLDTAQIDDSVVNQMSKDGPLPAAEFNESKTEDWSTFTEIAKPIHEEQAKVLAKQGLDKDTTRGVVSSSSQRESPSTVFGISTPGRPLDNTSASADDYRVYGRKGGHTFVMDDGDFEEKNKLVRLRTSGGHQIMMNDSEEVLYISNSTGDAWVELTGSGNVHIYGGSSINIRAKENFNLHADKDINLHAGGNFNMLSKKAFKLEGETISSLSTKGTTLYGSELKLGSSGQIDINPAGAGSFTGQSLTFVGQPIKLNSGSGPKVEKPEAITVYDLNEAEKDGSQWKTKEAALKSIAKIAPTHEPWPREAGKPSATSSSASSASNASGSGEGPDENTGTSAPTSNKVVTGSDGVAVDNVGKPVVSGTNSSSDAGPTDALTKSVRKPADKSYMSRDDNPTPSAGVGPLDATQVKALKTQIAVSESGFNYGATEAARGNYLGKYQIGAAVLTDQNYIKPDAYAKYGTSAVNYPSSWTGKDGVTSKEAFLANPTAQEASMDRLLNSNYKTLTKIGAVNSSDDPATVAGMLSTSHLLGAGGAQTWRRTGTGADANNTSGTSYFNMGRYAVNVLAKTS